MELPISRSVCSLDREEPSLTDEKNILIEIFAKSKHFRRTKEKHFTRSCFTFAPIIINCPSSTRVKCREDGWNSSARSMSIVSSFACEKRLTVLVIVRCCRSPGEKRLPRWNHRWQRSLTVSGKNLCGIRHGVRSEWLQYEKHQSSFSSCSFVSHRRHAQILFFALLRRLVVVNTDFKALNFTFSPLQPYVHIDGIAMYTRLLAVMLVGKHFPPTVRLFTWQFSFLFLFSLAFVLLFGSVNIQQSFGFDFSFSPSLSSLARCPGFEHLVNVYRRKKR